MFLNDKPHYLTLKNHDVVFYCPILNELFIYNVDFIKYNYGLFNQSGLVYIGEL